MSASLPTFPTMSFCDRLLRAAVYSAYDARGTDGYRQALEEVIRVHALAPLIEHRDALREAEATLARIRARRSAALDVLRETGSVLTSTEVSSRAA